MNQIGRADRDEACACRPADAADRGPVRRAAGWKRGFRPVGLGLAILALAAIAAHAADTTQADVVCRPAAKKLVYLCTLTLRDTATNRPLEGVELTVGADMPSMPMAHNVRPVKAKPASAAGVYEAEIELEMYGDWALRLRLAGPRTDVIVRRLRFEAGSVSPVR